MDVKTFNRIYRGETLVVPLLVNPNNEDNLITTTIIKSRTQHCEQGRCIILEDGTEFIQSEFMGLVENTNVIDRKKKYLCRSYDQAISVLQNAYGIEVDIIEEPVSKTASYLGMKKKYIRKNRKST